jgi:FemAB family protein
MKKKIKLLFAEESVKNGIKLKLLDEINAKVLWNDVFQKLSYQSRYYSPSSLEYQASYFKESSTNWVDLSSIIYHDDKPIGLWPLTLFAKDNIDRLTSQGLPILPPIFIDDCPDSRKKFFAAACLKVSIEIIKNLNVNAFQSREPFCSKFEFSDWHLLLLNNGAKLSIEHELYVDLSIPLNEIKKKFRKSYRSLVTSGEKLWKVEIHQSSIKQAIWDEFHSFHIVTANKVTRSIDSWDIQLNSIKSNESFLITLRDSNNTMVGASFFSTTKDEGAYGVGVYDRDLFDKPLGHVVQFQAICELKRRGCKWYKIGVRHYPNNPIGASRKEQSISKFKEGFATHVFPAYILEYNDISS